MAAEVRMQMFFFPVEGDTAYVELLDGAGHQWANLRLEGIDLSATGDARVADAQVVVSVFGLGGDDHLEVEYGVLTSALASAREQVLENERRRLPTEG